MRTIAVGLCMLTVSLAGCAGSQSARPSGSSGYGTPAPGTTKRQQAEASPAVAALTLEYLSAGSFAVWCARERGQEDDIAYAFYSDGTYRFGKQGEVVDGPGIDAFIRGVTVVSREEDRFVVDQAGRELVFSRGDCG